MGLNCTCSFVVIDVDPRVMWSDTLVLDIVLADDDSVCFLTTVWWSEVNLLVVCRYASGVSS